LLTELLFLRCYQKYFSDKLAFSLDSSLFLITSVLMELPNILNQAVANWVQLIPIMF